MQMAEQLGEELNECDVFYDVDCDNRMAEKIPAGVQKMISQLNLLSPQTWGCFKISFALNRKENQTQKGKPAFKAGLLYLILF